MTKIIFIKKVYLLKVDASNKYMNFLKKSTEILFQKMQFNDIEETATCIAQIFSNFEPMSKVLKISFNDFYPLAISICQKASEEEMSLIAKDQKTGEIAGFIISEDFMTINPDPPNDVDHKFESVFSLLSELEENYRKCHLIKTGQILHIFMLGVQEKYSKRHIATTLVRENLNLAKRHNFEIAMVEATGVASQQIFRNFGFIEEFAIEYKSYKFKGQEIFSSIENPSHCLLMSSTVDLATKHLDISMKV